MTDPYPGDGARAKALLESLRLREADVVAFAEVHEGFGRAALTRMEAGLAQRARLRGPADVDVVLEPEEDVLPLAASCLVLAASSRSLVDPARALGDWAHAAGLLRVLGGSFYVIVALCGPAERAAALLDNPEPPADDVDAALAQLLSSAWGGTDPRSASAGTGPTGGPDEPDMEANGGRPTGRRGLPLQAYARVLRATAGNANAARVVMALAEFLNRAAEPVLGAMADRYHWTRLYSTVLPVEPEFVALCRVVIRRLQKQDVFSQSLVAEVQRRVDTPVALVPLQVAINLDVADGLTGPPVSTPQSPPPSAPGSEKSPVPGGHADDAPAVDRSRFGSAAERDDDEEDEPPAAATSAASM